MLNQLVDKVYIINTRDAKLRMMEVTREMERNNIQFTRVEAVPLTKVVLPEDKGDNWDKWGWNICAVSLIETTIGIIEEAIQNNYKRIMIFEDDSYINDDGFNQLLPNIKKLMDVEREWHFIHLNYSGTNKFRFTPYGNIMRLSKGCLCCQSYIINHQIYETYLTELKKKKKPIDETTRDLHTLYKKSFIPSTPVVEHQKNRYSTIRRKDVPY